MNKKSIKKSFLSFIFAIEVVIFSFTYLFGTNGFFYLMNLKNENQDEKKEIQLIQDEIDDLQTQINQWDTEEFYKEKAARELQLARKNEQIYYIT